MNAAQLNRLWRRYWYHLCALVIIVPAVYLKPYLDSQAAFLGATETDLRSMPMSIGPWTLELQERSEEAPAWHPGDGFEKQFRIKPCTICVSQIRSIFISLKRPGSSAYGTPFAGNPYRAYAGMPIRSNASPDDEVWITAEGWDGSVHQQTIPLAQASPVTQQWLRQRPSR